MLSMFMEKHMIMLFDFLTFKIYIVLLLLLFGYVGISFKD